MIRLTLTKIRSVGGSSATRISSGIFNGITTTGNLTEINLFLSDTMPFSIQFIRKASDPKIYLVIAGDTGVYPAVEWAPSLTQACKESIREIFKFLAHIDFNPLQMGTLAYLVFTDGYLGSRLVKVSDPAFAMATQAGSYEHPLAGTGVQTVMAVLTNVRGAGRITLLPDYTPYIRWDWRQSFLEFDLDDGDLWRDTVLWAVQGKTSISTIV